jgi:hypothetical protein
MNRLLDFALVAIFSGLVSWVTIALMLRFGRVGPIDQPNHRSLHQVAVPRSGGAGILAGTAVGLLAATPPVVLWVALGGLVGVSLLDDFRSLPARIRFLVQLAAAAVVTWTLVPSGWGLAGHLFSVLCILWMTNLYNFMDGANGLAGGMAAFGFAAYALVASFAGQPDLALWSACIAAAAVGLPTSINNALGAAAAISFASIAATPGVQPRIKFEFSQAARVSAIATIAPPPLEITFKPSATKAALSMRLPTNRTSNPRSDIFLSVCPAIRTGTVDQ